MTRPELRVLALAITWVLLFSCNPGNERTNKDILPQPDINQYPTLEIGSVIQYTSAPDLASQFQIHSDFIIGEFTQPEEHFPTLMLDASKRFQIIEGFGGALTDASAETYYKLSPKKQSELLTAYFDQEQGLGYTLARTHINSCDFSSESYAYAEVSDDITLEHFSIKQDEKHKIPFIKEAFSRSDGKLKLLASPWSPPAWMKTNNNMLNGGKLKPEFYQTWANYYVRFIQAYEKHNLPIWGITVQNEPMAVQRWESCIYTAKEEKNFVKNYLGPTLHKSGMKDKKLIIWDHNRGIMFQRAKMAFDDPESADYIWGVGFHWYSGDHFENVKLLNEAYPNKKTIFTEGCVVPFDPARVTEWQWGVRYGESIIRDLNNSASGWIDWNILLNEYGGPNHVANFCYAPVIANTKTDELTYMSSFYYMGHFSKFIRPGARRIICSSNCDKLLATAAINPDGVVAVVVMNKSDEDLAFRIWMENTGTLLSVPGQGISTILITDNE